MSSMVRKVLATLAMSAAAATAASAQVNYTTTGQFTGGGAACNLTTNCVGPNGYSLSFLGAATTLPGLNPPTFSSLGTFVLTAGAGAVTVPSGVVFFTLTLNQTTPTVGTRTAAGSISGTVSSSPTAGFGSTLVWSPTQFINIDPIQYQILFDQPTGLSIALNGPLTETTVNARITTQAVPEPATVVLMGSGLAALGFFGARRKKA
jgi:hypothetical protein